MQCRGENRQCRSINVRGEKTHTEYLRAGKWTYGGVYGQRIVVACCCFIRSAYYVHEETYTRSTQLNLAKLTKEPSATYQIRLWSQRGTKVNMPHHGDILLRSPPPWFGIETKNQLVSCTNPQLQALCI